MASELFWPTATPTNISFSVKVLLDEGVPQPLAGALPGHDVHTVVGMGWASVKNGTLLALIGSEQFEAFVTGDKNMSNQRSLAGRPFATLVFSAISWPAIKHHLSAIASALDQAEPGAVVLVQCGVFLSRRAWKSADPSN